MFPWYDSGVVEYDITLLLYWRPFGAVFFYARKWRASKKTQVICFFVLEKQMAGK